MQVQSSSCVWLLVREEQRAQAEDALVGIMRPEGLDLELRTWEGLTVEDLDEEPTAIIVEDTDGASALATDLERLHTPQSHPHIVVVTARGRRATLRTALEAVQPEILELSDACRENIVFWVSLAMERISARCTAARLEQSVWQSEARLVDVLLRLHQPLVVVGHDDSVVFSNGPAMRLLGSERQALFGQPASALFYEGPRGRLRLRSPYDEELVCETLAITWQRRPARLVLMNEGEQAASISSPHLEFRPDVRREAPEFLATVAAVASELNARASRIEAVVDTLCDTRNKMNLLVHRLGAIATAHHRVFGGLSAAEPLQELLDELLLGWQEHLQSARQDLARLQRSAGYLQRTAHPRKRALELVTADAVVRDACRDFSRTHPDLPLSTRCSAGDVFVKDTANVQAFLAQLLAGLREGVLAQGATIRELKVQTRSDRSHLGLTLEVRLGDADPGGADAERVLQGLSAPTDGEEGTSQESLREALALLEAVGGHLRFGVRGTDLVWIDAVLEPGGPLHGARHEHPPQHDRAR